MSFKQPATVLAAVSTVVASAAADLVGEASTLVAVGVVAAVRGVAEVGIIADAPCLRRNPVRQRSQLPFRP